MAIKWSHEIRVLSQTTVYGLWLGTDPTSRIQSRKFDPRNLIQEIWSKICSKASELKALQISHLHSNLWQCQSKWNMNVERTWDSARNEMHRLEQWTKYVQSIVAGWDLCKILNEDKSKWMQVIRLYWSQKMHHTLQDLLFQTTIGPGGGGAISLPLSSLANWIKD